jgi:hypothetical protein
LGNDCGITHNTVRAWLSLLEASFILFLVYPHYKNFGKRLVKTPKLYFYDTGLASWLLGLQGPDSLSIHPLRGSLFESLAISELLKGRFNRGLPSNLFFWRNNSGDEIDVIVEQGDTLIPIEIKSGQTVTRDFFTGLSKWIRWAGSSAGPPYLIYGGNEDQSRSGIQVLSWKNIPRLANEF